MRSSLLVVFCLLYSIVTVAQSQPTLSREFGEVTMKDFDYVPDYDPDAPAVVLYDIGKTEFVDYEGWFQITFTKRKRIKILNADGLDHANFNILYYVDGYGKTELVREIRGVTINLSETGYKLNKTEFDTKEAYDEDINSRWKRKVIAMPQAKVGSIIDLEYKIVSPFFFNLPDWEFQSSIPTAYSEYTLELIPFYEYVALTQDIGNRIRSTNSVQGGIKRSWRGNPYDEVINKWFAKDIKGFKDESFITAREDYILKLDFQLSKFYSPYGGNEEILTTWPSLAEEFMDHLNFGKYIKKSKKLAVSILSSELSLNGLSEEKKAEQIIEYSKNRFHWNKFYGDFSSDSNPENLLKSNSGNIGAINLFLVAMLQEAGIETYPVILSTRGHGKVWKEYPFESFFNYTLAYVKTDKTNFLADATQPSLDYNRIAPFCINEQGLVINEPDPYWINLQSGVPSVDQKNFKIEVDPTTLTINSSNFTVLSEFRAYHSKQEHKDDKESLEKDLLSNGFDKIDDLQTKNFDTPSRPYFIAFSGESTATMIDNKIIIKPFFDSVPTSSPFMHESRDYPVDLIYPRQNVYNSTIIIPEGYKVAYAPETYTMSDDLFSLQYSVSIEENQVIIRAHSETKASTYSPSQYKALKLHYEKATALFNESIVLEKH